MGEEVKIDETKTLATDGGGESVETGTGGEAAAGDDETEDETDATE